MFYKNLFVVLCFFLIVTLMGQLWSYLKLAVHNFNPVQITGNDLKILLNYRGVKHDKFIEKKDLWQLVNATGRDISYTELKSSRESSLNEGVCTSTNTAVIIPNEELFYELVEDSKDSAWILMTILPKSIEQVNAVDRERLKQVWCYIQSIYWKFGVNMAILDCGKLYNLCWDRGFHRSPFVLVLPRGRDRVKDSVDFFVYPYSIDYSKDPQITNQQDMLQNSISNWLHQRLAHRVDLNFNYLSNYSHQANFISVFSQKKDLWSNYNLSLYYQPSLAVSTHSFKFTGRIHFSIGLDSELPPVILNKIRQLYPTSWESPSYFFISQDDDIIYLYGNNYGQTLNFESLQLFFRHLCPSTNDIFIWNLILVNLMISFQAAFQTGSLALRLGYYLWYLLVFNVLYCCFFLFVLSALSFSPLLARVNYYLLKFWRKLALTRFVNHLRYLQLNQDIDLVLFLATWSLFVLIIGKFHKDGDTHSSGTSTSTEEEYPEPNPDSSDENYSRGEFNFPYDPEVNEQIALLSTLGSFNLTLQQQPPLYISRLLQWSFQVPRRLASKLAHRYKAHKASIKRPQSDDQAQDCKPESTHMSLPSEQQETTTNNRCDTQTTTQSTHTQLRRPPMSLDDYEEDYEGSSSQETSNTTPHETSNNTSPATVLCYRQQTGVHTLQKTSNSSHPIKWPVGYIFTDQCCICLQRYRRYELLCGLPCGHAFHDSCIKQWLIQCGKNDCPQCRWPAYKQKP